MPAPTAPLLDAAGKKAKDVTLEASVFAAEIKPHLVHETVRAEMNEQRSATRGAKTRGFVSGGRSKPWRQKGTGRARAGTTRARRPAAARVAAWSRAGARSRGARRAPAAPAPTRPALRTGRAAAWRSRRTTAASRRR